MRFMYIFMLFENMCYDNGNTYLYKERINCTNKAYYLLPDFDTTLQLRTKTLLGKGI